MTEAKNGGRRIALPAFFALTSVVLAALAIIVARRPETDPAATLPAASVPAAKPVSVAEEATREVPAIHEQRVLEIERALVSSDSLQRERAFNVHLPKLLDAEPARVVELVARQQGETRDTLRDEVVRLWIRKDRDAAIVWMGSFEHEWERKASATTAMRSLAAIEPAQAIAVADQFGIGRDDGSLEYIVQIWATENFDEAAQWLEKQPDNSSTALLRARIEQVREQLTAARQ